MKTQNFWNIIVGAVVIASCQPLAAIAEISMKRDYEYQTPLPQTGQVTIRKPIKDLPANKLFESCPLKSDLQDFAESTNFLIIVCRDRQDNLQKYWIQKAKKTGKILRLTVKDEPNSQPSLWKSGDYQLTIYADGIGRGNAYFELFNMKKQKGRAEALIYHYDKFYR